MSLVNLVVLRAKDIEKTRLFYETLLGQTFDEHTDHGPRHYGTTLGTTYFEIYSAKGEIQPTDSIGFSVDSIESRVEKVGAHCVYRAAQPSPFGRFAILKDPDNRNVHITEEKL